MEIVAAVAAVGALAVPGWLFARTPVWAGSAVTLVLFFCAGFFGALSDDRDATARAFAWGSALGAAGGIGFYVARRFEAMERRHPVDPARFSPAQLRIRRIGIPVAVLTLVWIVGGLVAVLLDLVAFAVWAAAGVALFLSCTVLYGAFLRWGTSD